MKNSCFDVNLYHTPDNLLEIFGSREMELFLNRTKKASQNEMLNFCPLCVAEVYALWCDAMLARMLQKHAVVADNATTGTLEHQRVTPFRHMEQAQNH